MFRFKCFFAWAEWINWGTKSGLRSAVYNLLLKSCGLWCLYWTSFQPSRQYCLILYYTVGDIISQPAEEVGFSFEIPVIGTKSTVTLTRICQYHLEHPLAVNIIDLQNYRATPCHYGVCWMLESDPTYGHQVLQTNKMSPLAVTVIFIF